MSFKNSVVLVMAWVLAAPMTASANDRENRDFMGLGSITARISEKKAECAELKDDVKALQDELREIRRPVNDPASLIACHSGCIANFMETRNPSAAVGCYREDFLAAGFAVNSLDCTLEVNRSACGNSPAQQQSKSFSASGNVSFTWTLSPNNDACFRLYQAQVQGKDVSASCMNTILNAACPKVRNEIRKSQIGEAGRRGTGELADAENAHKECLAELRVIEQEKAEVIAACPNCMAQMQMADAMRPRDPTTGDYILGGLQVLTPAILGGLNTWAYAKGVSKYAGMYGDYLDQCRSIGIPCQGPGMMGWGGMGFGIAGGGIYGGMYGGGMMGSIMGGSMMGWGGSIMGGGYPGMIVGGIVNGIGGGIMGGGYPGMMVGGFPGGYPGGGMMVGGFPGGYPGGGMMVGGFPGGYPGGGMMVGGFPGGMGAGIVAGIASGFTGFNGGMGMMNGGMTGFTGFNGGFNAGFGMMNGGMSGFTGFNGGMGMMNGGIAGFNTQYYAMMQASLQAQQLNMQRAMMQQQNVMIAQQQVAEAMMRYQSTLSHGYGMGMGGIGMGIGGIGMGIGSGVIGVSGIGAGVIGVGSGGAGFTPGAGAGSGGGGQTF